MTSVKYGGRPLDAMLAYLDLRQKNYPFLSNALAVYRQVFAIQDRFCKLFELDGPADLGTCNGDGPLVPGRLPGLDPDQPLRVLAEISNALTAAAPDRGSQIQAARRACECDDILLRRSYRNELNPILETLRLLTLNPFYEKFAREIVPRIEEVPWRLGYCPVCGETPSVAAYKASAGVRYVQCRLCRTQWDVPRIGCIFCDCEESDKLSYLQADDVTAHRVEICDACGGYLKVVDERALMKTSILHVEELFMSALDQEAITRGYTPGRSRARKEEDSLYGSQSQ